MLQCDSDKPRLCAPRVWRAFSVILLLLALSACACRTRVTRIGERHSELDLCRLPAKEPILTIDGAISKTNHNGSLELDMGMLEGLGLVQYTTDDPWRQTAVSYTGVLLQDLVESICDQAPKSIHLQALDGYETDIPSDELSEWPVLLATRCENAYISVGSGGPTRIIFPYDDYPDLAHARSMSIWNIERITIQ